MPEIIPDAMLLAVPATVRSPMRLLPRSAVPDEVPSPAERAARYDREGREDREFQAALDRFDERIRRVQEGHREVRAAIDEIKARAWPGL
jgi:hypothetical protein